MSINDGGPAFPRPVGAVQWANGPEVSLPQDGMSLRDWFAGQALAGMIAGRFQPPPMPETEVDEAVAECAYIYADAMLLARTKGGGK